ncbi:ScpA family protein [Aminivibrio sp.]|uniref:segregation and condensation protein A n=1 Tax=Aminivibrio sp. TaxID=1872489 RepID=UPI00345ED2C7
MVQNHDLSGFQAEVSGFSGPFDLLCYLVENRQLDAAGISVGQAVRIYGAYLANTRRVSVAVISEFLVLAASLVLNKIRSLLPGKTAEQEDGPCGTEEESRDEFDVEEKLSRYRPYRKASAFLWNKKEKQDLVFSRPSSGDEGQTWDLGDLYGLCSLWWDILEEKRGSGSSAKSTWMDREDNWEGMPVPLPDEEQIDMKISEIMGILKNSPAVSFSKLLGNSRSVSVFVVTLLSLLEMSRMGRIRIVQEELFRDVLIYSI